MKGKYRKRMLFTLLIGIILICTNLTITLSDENKNDHDDIVKLKWMGPHGLYEDYLERRTTEPFTSHCLFESCKKDGEPWILIFININLLPDINSEIMIYNQTINSLGYNTVIIETSGGTEEDLKSEILTYWNNDYEIKGIVLVGDHPAPWYNIESEDSEFPCDLYLMDLDGEWMDTDDDGMYESHTDGSGDAAPEIYLGRIDASYIPGDEISITKAYFKKIKDFWNGDIEHSDIGLTYTEEDWSYYDDQKFSIQYAYPDYEAIWYPDVNRNDYMDNRLNNETYEFIQLSCHSWSNAHYFTDGGQATNDQIRADPPNALFYNLFCCGTLRYTDYNCVGNAYILDTNSPSLSVVGSSKSGSMLDFQPYYSALDDQSFGQAFQTWFEYEAPYSESDKSWFYGMTILGDPTLEIDHINPHLSFEFPNGLPEVISPGQSINITVEIHEKLDSYIPNSGRIYYCYNGETYQSSQLVHVSDITYEANLPAVTCGDTPEFYFSAQGISSGINTNPLDAPNNTYSSVVGILSPIFSDDFEIENNWTVENDAGLTTGAWERGIPVGGGDRGDPASDYDGSGQCYLTGNTDDDSDIDGGTTWLISPTINLDSGLDVYVSFALWYSNDYGGDPNNDYFKTYVSDDNGESWILAGTIGPNSLSGWVEKSFILNEYITPTDQVKIRFEASDLNEGSVVEAGIDAVNISIFECDSGPLLAYNPKSYSFGILNEGETDMTSFEIWNVGNDILNYSISESYGWLAVSPMSGNSTGEHDSIMVGINTTGLSNGSYLGEINITSNDDNSVFTISFYLGSGLEIIDVDQSTSDRGFPIRHALDGDWAAAQSFIPNLNTITRADIWLRKFGTPEFNLTVELRENHPQGILIYTLIFTPEEVPSSWEWFLLNFEDTSIIPGVEYFIVCPPVPSGVTTSFGYEWGYAFGNQYDDGAFWFTRDGGGLWRDLPTMYEFTFRTYGYS